MGGISLPCQLVWQEAKVRKLDTGPTSEFNAFSLPEAARTR